MNVLIAFGSYAPAPRGDQGGRPPRPAPRGDQGGRPPRPAPRAGAELMAIRTGAALADKGHSVTFLTDGPCPAATLPPPAAGALDCAAGPGRDPDLVHAFDLARPATVKSGLGLARRLRVPLVLTPASAREVWPDPAFGDEACAAADRVLALTQAEIDDLALPDRSLARQVGQGPSLSGRGDPAAFRRMLPGDGPVVLFLGRRSLLKGLDVLALAAPLVWRAVPDALFAVAGPPGDADDYVAAVGDTRFVDLGAVDLPTKTDAIAGCSLLCLPSRADVFPLVFVEAWTLGRAVVSGDFRGAGDVVRHGVDGLICAVRPEPVAESVISLLTDQPRCARLGAAGHERAVRDLTWEAVAADVEACYQELAGAEGSVG